MANVPDHVSTSENASLTRWIKTLNPVAAAVVNYAVFMQQRVVMAREDYPGHSAYVQSLERAAKLAIHAANVATGWSATARLAMQADLNRVEAPRNGNLSAERRADNGAAQFDRDNWNS